MSNKFDLELYYDKKYRISSPYGPRDLGNGDTRFHHGIDLVGLSNKNILAPTNGVITRSSRITNKSNSMWEYGNLVIMDDLNGYLLYFAHLSERLVKVGDTVNKRQVIGVEGWTGYVVPQNPNGSHLHFEVRKKSTNTRVDPLEYQKILFAWEAAHLKKLRDNTQKRFGFDNNTMLYLDDHPYPESLYTKLSEMK